MATKRMKHDDGMEQDQNPEKAIGDRISDLPDVIILHILSFLPTICAIRTSLLSKRWRRMWTLIPVLDFSDTRDIPYFKRHGERKSGWKKFYKFVDECLEHPYADSIISKFKLHMEHSGGNTQWQLVGWLRFLLKKNVQELDLHLVRCCLPQFIHHLRALTLLKLNGLTLYFHFPSSLPSLKELYLSNIKMEDQVFQYLLKGCPSLEILHVNLCHGLFKPKVTSSSLKSMEFRTKSGMETIEVEAINLHSFLHSQGGNNKCSINLSHCRAIRNLSLIKARLTDQWLEDLISRLPLLESLKLVHCYGLQHIKIRNRHLKHFVLSLDRRLDSLEATIDAPNLVSFCYRVYSMFEISVDAPNLSDAYIKLPNYLRKTYDVRWYANQIKFFSEFKSSKNVRVFSSNEKALIIPHEVKKMCSTPLPDLKHMKVRIGGQPFREAMLRKSLLWIAPSNLETLLIG